MVGKSPVPQSCNSFKTGQVYYAIAARKDNNVLNNRYGSDFKEQISSGRKGAIHKLCNTIRGKRRLVSYDLNAGSTINGVIQMADAKSTPC